MRHLAPVLLFLVLASSVQSQDVNGYREETGGKTVVRVYGTHHERGYAQGYLLGDQTKRIFDEYFVDIFCGGSAASYNLCRTLCLNEYAPGGEILAEIDGMLAGMTDGGVDLYNTVLGRSIDATDLRVLNLVVDLAERLYKRGPGCSSLSSWGTSTSGDPELDGHLMITRLLDWDTHPSLTAGAAMVVHFPSEPEEQKWVSFGFAGLLGTLSGISESGLGGFYHVGNVEGMTPNTPYEPILYTLRRGLERADYDGDGYHTAEDVVAAFSDRSRSSTGIINVVLDDGALSVPRVIEVNGTAGIAYRQQADNTIVPGEHLVATNHFRVLYSPIFCSRYQGITNELIASMAMTPDRAWSLMGLRAGVNGNLQVVQYLPSLGKVRWATNTDSQPAYQRPPTDIYLGMVTSAPDEELPARPKLVGSFPNPFNPRTTLYFDVGRPQSVQLDVYDVGGRHVRELVDGIFSSGRHQVVWDGTDEDGLQVGTGTYLLLLRSEEGEERAKVMLLK